MKDFYIKMRYLTINGKSFFYVQYWWNTDLRYDTKTDDIPVEEIVEWLRS